MDIEYEIIEKEGIVEVIKDGDFKSYPLVELPDRFIEWSISERLKVLDMVKEHKFPEYLEGPHNGMVATCGNTREDDVISINNAVKGVGYLPKKDKVDELIEKMKETKKEGLSRKVAVLHDFYNNFNKYFRKDGLLSLELYTHEEYRTKTYLNLIKNPEYAMVFLDMPTFQVKGIARLVHPDEDVPSYERKIFEYANLIHSYFHGHFSRDFIAIIFYVSRVFDSTPGKGGKGVRIG